MLKDYYTIVIHYLAPKRLLTYFAGFMANIEMPSIKNRLIRRFVRVYDVKMQDAIEENITAYASFNHFFIRHLKSYLRPVAHSRIVSPVDGCVSACGLINEGKLLQAKGRYYTVEQLLHSQHADIKHFNEGSFATFYLSPKDYHRIHMPIKGRLRKMIYIPGRLFSVQPTTARLIPYLFARNERVVAFFDTAVGSMAMVLVGATLVGSIATAWQGEMKRSRKSWSKEYSSEDITLEKGQEMGYFKLGSTVIILFEKVESPEWLQVIRAGSVVQFGQAI